MSAIIVSPALAVAVLGAFNPARCIEEVAAVFGNADHLMYCDSVALIA